MPEELPPQNWILNNENHTDSPMNTPRRVGSPVSIDESLDSVQGVARNPTGRGSIGSSSGSVNDCFSEAPSRRTSASSAPSTADVRPVQALNTTVFGPNLVPRPHDLPCEFEFVGCSIGFPSAQYDQWYQHSLSHFTPAGPPRKAICIFCDESDAIFVSANDNLNELNWRARMHHIAEHYEAGALYEKSRPDYFLIEHMEVQGRINKDNFEAVMSHTERPKIITLVPTEYKTPEMVARNKKNEAPLMQAYNQKDEDRMRLRARRGLNK